MLATLKSQDFVPKLGANLEVFIDNGQRMALRLIEVKENEKSRLPYAEPDSRTPFSLIFKGPLEPSIQSYGLCTIKGLVMGDIEGLHISRIIPESADLSAWYQIIFN